MRRRRRIALAAVSMAGWAIAAAPAHGASTQKLPLIDTSDADRCDFIAKPNRGLCLLPFPNDYYTVKDPDTLTGRRINLKTAAMPANVDGKHIDARPYNLNDGFSPGQPIVLKVPGLNSTAAMNRTGAVPINDIGRYRDPAQPIVLIDAETGKRRPIWANIDSNASEPGTVALEIHPARNLAAHHRYIVALRNLKTAGGQTIQAPAAFRYYRDRIPSDQGAINRRRAHFEGIFKTLKEAGIGRGNLYLAWDFTVASDWNIASRMLRIRNDAFAELGDTNLADRVVQGDSPAFDVTSVTNFTPAQDAQVARRVKGTFTVPCYLAPDCAPGGRFQLDTRGAPTRHGDWTANFDCIIPRSAVQGTPSPARPSLYGHGLFGSAAEVSSGPQAELANTYNFVLCATDEIGMSQGDLPNTAGILQRPVRVPRARRPAPAGAAQRALPGAGDDPSSGLQQRSRLPRQRHPGHPFGDQQEPALLRRQQPGRDHGRRPHRRVAGLHARGARRGGDAVLAPPPARSPLRRLRGGPLPPLPERARPAVDVLADPDAVGPRRAQRLRAPDDGLATAGDATAQGAVEHRLRRPSGVQLGGRCRGANDRRLHSRAGP